MSQVKIAAATGDREIITPDIQTQRSSSAKGREVERGPDSKTEARVSDGVECAMRERRAGINRDRILRFSFAVAAPLRPTRRILTRSLRPSLQHERRHHVPLEWFTRARGAGRFEMYEVSAWYRRCERETIDTIVCTTVH